MMGPGSQGEKQQEGLSIEKPGMVFPLQAKNPDSIQSSEDHGSGAQQQHKENIHWVQSRGPD